MQQKQMEVESRLNKNGQHKCSPNNSFDGSLVVTAENKPLQSPIISGGFFQNDQIKGFPHEAGIQLL